MMTAVQHSQDGCGTGGQECPPSQAWRRSPPSSLSDNAKSDGVVIISAEAWFQWMNQMLMSSLIPRSVEQNNDSRYRFRIIDGTHVHEPGPTGSCWRIHYAIDLPTLRCTEFYITDSKGVGTREQFKRFTVHQGDIFIGDRIYGYADGITHVLSGGGDVLVRFGWNSIPFLQIDGKPFKLFEHLRTFRGTHLADWPVCINYEDRMIPGRICALRRSRQATEKALKSATRRSQKSGFNIRDETLEAAYYLFVFTTISSNKFSPSQILEFYRGRWQVELVFKRLKSLMALGHLRKYDDKASRAWLQGKLFIALLIEILLHYSESFSPWGYPIQPEE